MLASDVMLAINRANTQRFIDADPTSIILTPSTANWDTGTKSYEEDDDRPEQTFKVIWSGGDGIVVNSLGTTRKFDFILVGSFDAEVAIGDHWSHDTQKYRIEYIQPSNGYEVKCGGFSIGANP